MVIASAGGVLYCFEISVIEGTAIASRIRAGTTVQMISIVVLFGCFFAVSWLIRPIRWIQEGADRMGQGDHADADHVRDPWEHPRAPLGHSHRDEGRDREEPADRAPEEEGEDDPDRGRQQPRFDRVANEEDARDRERDPAGPDGQPAAEYLFEIERSRRSMFRSLDLFGNRSSLGGWCDVLGTSAYRFALRRVERAHEADAGFFRVGAVSYLGLLFALTGLDSRFRLFRR